MLRNQIKYTTSYATCTLVIFIECCSFVTFFTYIDSFQRILIDIAMVFEEQKATL